MELPITNYNQQIAETIKRLRIRKGVEQAKVARLLNVHVTTYNKIENSKTELTINNLFKIAEALKTNIGELLPAHLSNNFYNHKNIVLGQYNNGT